MKFRLFTRDSALLLSDFGTSVDLQLFVVHKAVLLCICHNVLFCTLFFFFYFKFNSLHEIKCQYQYFNFSFILLLSFVSIANIFLSIFAPFQEVLSLNIGPDITFGIVFFGFLCSLSV